MMETIFRWIHLSDIHMGHGDTTFAWDQQMVLDEVKRDVARQMKAQPEPPIDAIFVTGDIGNTGAGRRADEYGAAATWLAAVGDAAGVKADQVFVVPGNHDVDRGADKDPATAALVSDLRTGVKTLDDALADAAARALLAHRMEKYLAFALAFGPRGVADRLFWTHRLVARSGLPVRLVGLNTALLAADDLDQGKLRLGMAQMGSALKDVEDGELVLALGHHPLGGGWLADAAEIRPFLMTRVHALLTGHVHAADAEESRVGSSDTFLRIVAGSAHGDKMPPGIPAGHGYSFGSVVRTDKGQAAVRIIPRKWAAKIASFRSDVENTPEGQTFSEHPLSKLVLSTAVASTAKRAAAPPAVEVVPDTPVPIFVSCVPEDDELRKLLIKHMAPLRLQKKVVFKHSQEATGDRGEWIRARLDEARIILLLVSTDYVGAEDEDELLHAIDRHDRGEARVIPVQMRKFYSYGTPFAKLQALPRDGKPVDGDGPHRDAACARIAWEVGKVVAEMRGEPTPPEPR
jgi:predicted MPP superfamily phosphohydrolase